MNMFYEVKSLKKYTLCGRDGTIGKVRDVLFDDRKWTVRYLVADTGNWLKDRKILIKPEFLASVDAELQCITVNLTKKQIEDSPPLSSDKPVSAQFDKTYSRFFSFMDDLEGLPFMKAMKSDLDRKSEQERLEDKRSWDRHLRSTEASAGLVIEAPDGEAGCIDDFIVDDQSWKIRYLIVAASAWHPGKKLLVSPLWVTTDGWGTSKVFISTSREPFKGLPEYTSPDMLTRDYEVKLHQVCGRDGYWSDSADCVKQ